MGSSGSGSISDYPGSSSSKSGGPGGGSNDTSEDRCAKAFSMRLEDVEHSEYYRKHRTIPPTGTQLEVAQRKRLVAQTTAGESIGNLPTALNYLAACMKAGWSYIGAIQSVASAPSRQHLRRLRINASKMNLMEPVPLLVGEICVDFTLTGPGKQNKLRLGGIAYAARGFWALDAPFSAAVIVPTYLEDIARKYLHARKRPAEAVLT